MAAMTLFPLQFHTDIEGTRELFFRGSAAVNESGALAFNAGGTAAFDTYFNLFSHEKYAKYCGISSARLRLNGRGTFRAKLSRKTEDGDELLKSAEFSDSLELPFDFPAGGGFVWFSLEAPAGGELYSGAFEADIPAPNEVKLGVVICTYKREVFVARSIERVQKAISAEPAWAEKLHFFIADNAKTLNLPESPLYTVYPNKNLGGSGGFTRGIMEVCKDPSFTHFLLMDDDISFEFATLERTYDLLRALSPEHRGAAVGGAMLVLERPTEQYELGAKFTGMRLLSRNHGRDLADTAQLLCNERGADANFTAWWYCCMPADSARKYGLPMPFFIKGDDVEYGVRCIRDLILLNGIGIWHQDFSAKYNSALEYYSKRNELTAGALHFPAGAVRPKFSLLYNVYKQLTLKNYAAAELVLRAYEDFLRGPRFFAETDAEELNAQLMAARPVPLPAEQLRAMLGAEEAKGLYEPPAPGGRLPAPLRILLMAENFLPAAFFRKDPVLVPAHDTPVRRVFLRRTAVLYNFAAKEGYVCELDKKRRAAIRRRTRKLFFAYLFRFRKVRKALRAAAPELCSAAAWESRFAER